MGGGGVKLEVGGKRWKSRNLFLRTLAATTAVAWLVFLHLHFFRTSQQNHQIGQIGQIHRLLLDLQLEDPYRVLLGQPQSLCIDVGGHVGWTAGTMAAAVCLLPVHTEQDRAPYRAGTFAEDFPHYFRDIVLRCSSHLKVRQSHSRFSSLLGHCKNYFDFSKAAGRLLQCR